jgi:hypothetical protein
MPQFLKNVLKQSKAAKSKKGRAAEADSPLAKQHADMKKYKGVSTTYDHNRPKRQVVTRYTR